jgi:hypothetical protein
MCHSGQDPHIRAAEIAAASRNCVKPLFAHLIPPGIEYNAGQNCLFCPQSLRSR